MQIPLNEFQTQISEKILSRGLSYFLDGHVHDPDQLDHGYFEFIVEGTEDYTVQIRMDGDIITGFTCDCPYDMGPVCKHVTAAMYYLQAEEAGISEEAEKEQNAKTKQTSGKKKRKTIAEQVSELLEKISHDDLKAFIKDKTERDRTFRNQFLAAFVHLSDNESKALYAAQIQSILRAASGRHGFIDWSDARIVGDAVDDMLESAENQLNAENYQSVFFICSAIMEELTKALQYADDSNGDIGGSITAAFDMLHNAAVENTDEQIRKQILEYCLSAFKNEIYKGWDWHEDIMQLAASLTETEEETERVLGQIENAEGSDYLIKIMQNMKYELLLKAKRHEEADHFLEQHIENPALRGAAIQKAIDINDYEKAKRLAKDGIAYDEKDRPGLVKTWVNWLLKIAMDQKKTEKIIEYARFLLIANFMPEHDYFQILKEHVKPENWKAFLEKVVEDLLKGNLWRNQPLIGEIFIREEWWDRLMEMVKKDGNLRTIAHYEKYLSKDYAEEIVDMYAAGVMKHVQNNVGRNHYQNACRYLRRMIKLGGKDKAERTITLLKEKYPRRRALLEELDSV